MGGSCLVAFMLFKGAHQDFFFDFLKVDTFVRQAEVDCRNSRFRLPYMQGQVRTSDCTGAPEDDRVFNDIL